MVKKGPVLLIGIGIIIAIIVTLISYRWLQTRAKTQIKARETVSIAVAAIDLAWGTNITNQMVKYEPYLKTSLPQGYQTSSTPLQGRTVIYPIKANEPILESRLAPTSIKTGGMAAVVTPNKRAMAVKVDKVVGVSGFIFPGTRVDVLVTLSSQGERQSAITKIVLENILVLAAGPEVDTSSKQQKPSAVDVITLEVTPEEAEKLALASTQGKLQLALRNYNDTTDVATKGTTIPVLLSSYTSAVPQRPAVTGKTTSAPPVHYRHRVVVSVGTQTKETVNFR